MWYALAAIVLIWTAGQLHSLYLDAYERKLERIWGITPSWKRS